MIDKFTLASHPTPLSDERSIEAWTYIDLSHGRGWEKLFVAPSGEGTWRLCNLPYYVYGLKVGDIVRVDQHGRIFELISSPDAGAYRLRIRDPSDRELCLVRLEDFIIEPMFTSFIGVQSKDCHPVGTLEIEIAQLMDEGMVLDAEDVLASEFDPGPEPTEPAREGDGPRIHEATTRVVPDAR